MNERELIAQILTLTPDQAPGLIKGIGDDCAVIAKSKDQAWLLTMDTLIESVHFDCSWHPPYELGCKAVAVNVSDIAAMGGAPVFVLLSLGLPSDFDDQWATLFNRGITETCNQYGCLLIGGDTVCSPGGITLSLTVIGEMPANRVLYRDNGKVGDTVWVSGPLGRAGAGLDLCKTGKSFSDPVLLDLMQAHKAPRARLELGVFLAKTGLVRSMMDLSDGLATDLSHLCARSGVGARIITGQLPGKERLETAAKLLDRQPLDWMISGGEDYELLFTASADVQKQLTSQLAEHGHTAYPVGTLVKGQGVVLQNKSTGTIYQQDISYKGYDHF